MKPRQMCALALSSSLSVLVLIGGCGPKEEHPATVPVHGKITYKGQPVPKGTISFQPDSGQTATAEIQSDGTYELATFNPKDGALPGHHKVMIVANTADPNMIPGSSPGYVPPKDIVPRKYGQFETSGLEVDVTKEKSDYDFDLK